MHALHIYPPACDHFPHMYHIQCPSIYPLHETATQPCSTGLPPSHTTRNLAIKSEAAGATVITWRQIPHMPAPPIPLLISTRSTHHRVQIPEQRTTHIQPIEFSSQHLEQSKTPNRPSPTTRPPPPAKQKLNTREWWTGLHPPRRARRCWNEWRQSWRGWHGLGHQW